MSKAPTSAWFLVLGAAKGKVLMEDMPKRRNTKSASRCPMCFQKDELIYHLFVQWVSSFDYRSPYWELIGCNLILLVIEY